ncbi:MAG: hypothetical protein CMJ20_14355 [Phycisphaeraceae bacterium]|nr:hypothetical protein [Phycisphaeraceae bacterium]
MRKKTLMLIGSAGCSRIQILQECSDSIGTLRSTPRDLVHHVLQHWSPGDHPIIEQYTLSSVLDEPSSLNSCDVVWLLSETQHMTDQDRELIGLLQDRHVPCMVTRPCETNTAGATISEGVVAAPPNIPPASIAAILQTLWSQADVVQGLKTELSLLHLHHGGLVNEFGKMDEELRLAAQLQQDFLPTQMPTVNGVDFHVLFRPAGYVSGDIYDVRRLDANHIGFFLVDAVGHGVPAALMTIYIKCSLTVCETVPTVATGSRIVSPANVLSRLNHDLLEHESHDKVRTATAVYGVVNVDTLELQIARAGHPYPLLLRGDGSLTAIEPEGAMLGVFPGEEFEVSRIQLDLGDRLLLYSDGFELAFPGDHPRQAGNSHPIANNRYLDEFKNLASGSAKDALARLSSKLDCQAGSLSRADDLTVLLMDLAASPTMITPRAENYAMDVI